MNKLAACWILVVVACLAGPRPAAGQDDGIGGFLDWIHRLSGPSMLGPAGSWYWDWETLRVRVAGAYLFPVAPGDKIAEGYGLNMLSLRPSLEIPVWGPLEVSAGLDLNRFGGKGHSPVVDLAVPLYGQLRFAVGSEARWYPRIGVGARYFASFEDGDFNDSIRVKRDGGELSFHAILGVDYRLGSGGGNSDQRR